MLILSYISVKTELTEWKAMRVLVLGATGFIGRPLMRRLAAMGHEPIGVARRPGPDPDLRLLALDRVQRATVRVRKRPPLEGEFRAFAVEVSRAR